MGQPRPLFNLFSSFQTHITIFTTNKCEKCTSSIQYRDSNSQPLEHESHPITTRLGLPLILPPLCIAQFFSWDHAQARWTRQHDQCKKMMMTHHWASHHDHDAGEVRPYQRGLWWRRLHIRHDVHEEGQRHLERVQSKFNLWSFYKWKISLFGRKCKF